MAAQPTSLREIRAELRKLPRDRRREIGNAIRAGRAVADPRDASLTVAWAENLDKRRRTWMWPRWVMPRDRPHGWKAWLWLLHAAWLLVALALASRYEWRWFSSPWRYLVLAWLAYSAVTTPFIIARTLRTFWNAPLAVAANRRLLQETAHE